MAIKTCIKKFEYDDENVSFTDSALFSEYIQQYGFKKGEINLHSSSRGIRIDAVSSLEQNVIMWHNSDTIKVYLREEDSISEQITFGGRWNSEFINIQTNENGERYFYLPSETHNGPDTPNDSYFWNRIGLNQITFWSGEKILYCREITPKRPIISLINQTDKNKLKEYFLSWGMELIISDWETENFAWQMQSKTSGWILEWKGDLKVKVLSDKHISGIKWKNKTNSFGTALKSEMDANGDFWIDLNNGSWGYSNASWRYIYIEKFTLLMHQSSAYLTNGINTMKDIVEFMSIVNNPPETGKVPTGGYPLTNELIQYTDPIAGYSVPNYLINNSNVWGWGNNRRAQNTDGKYRMSMLFKEGASSANKGVYNFNLVDEAAVVIYSDMDEDLSRDNTLNTIEYTDNGVYVNDVCKLEWFNPAKDLLLIATSSGMEIENSNYKYTINLKTSGRIPGGNNFTPQTKPYIDVYIPTSTSLNYNYTTTFNWKWYSFFDIEKNTKYILKDIISNKKEATLLTSKINHLYTKDDIKITGGFSESSHNGTITGNSNLWVDYEDCQYVIRSMSFSLSKKNFTINHGLHVKGNKEKYTYDFNFLNNSPDSKIFQIHDNCSFSDYQPGYSYAASKSYNITRGYGINISNNLLHRFSITERNNTSKTDDYLYGKMGDKVYRKETLGFNEAHEYISRNSKLWAIVCIKNYFVKNPLTYPTMKLYTSGNALGCEVLNSLGVNTNFNYMQSTNIRHSTDISPNETKTLWFDYGWSSQSLIDESFIKYEHPLLGEQSVPFSDISRKYNREFSIYKDTSASDYFIYLYNETTEPAQVTINNNSIVSSEEEDVLVLNNWSSAPGDFVGEQVVEYYHPDKCQWFSVKFKDIPSLIPNGSVSELHEIFDSSGISSGTRKQYSAQTNIIVERFDVLSVAVSEYEGFNSPKATLVSKEKVNGKWKITYDLTWNGGGPNYARVKTAINCAKYTY